jgi:hypothetical protein
VRPQLSTVPMQLGRPRMVEVQCAAFFRLEAAGTGIVTCDSVDQVLALVATRRAPWRRRT